VNQTATGPDRIAAELAADLDAGFAAPSDERVRVRVG
jgi:hypothetical protein